MFRRLFCIKFTLLIGLIAFAPLPASAQFDSESELVANWVYNLIPYIKWPGNKHHEITVCTVGPTPIMNNYLEELIEKEKKQAARQGRKLPPTYVRQKNPISDFKDCDILFIAPSERDIVDDLFYRVRSNPVLTVSTLSDFAAKGGMIEFSVQKNERVKLFINATIAQNAGLVIDGDLLGIAQSVR